MSLNASRCVSGLRTEGLFRRSARVQLIKEVQKLYNLGEWGLPASAAGALWSLRSSEKKNTDRKSCWGQRCIKWTSCRARRRLQMEITVRNGKQLVFMNVIFQISVITDQSPGDQSITAAPGDSDSWFYCTDHPENLFNHFSTHISYTAVVLIY